LAYSFKSYIIWSNWWFLRKREKGAKGFLSGRQKLNGITWWEWITRSTHSKYILVYRRPTCIRFVMIFFFLFLTLFFRLDISSRSVSKNITRHAILYFLYFYKFLSKKCLHAYRLLMKLIRFWSAIALWADLDRIFRIHFFNFEMI